MKSFVLSLDQGTTSSRAVLIDEKASIVGLAQKEFGQIFPKPGWVEHDPIEIWQSQLAVMNQVLEEQGVSVEQIKTIGITNQRETTVVWNRHTGKPIYNAIVWQDKRTSETCNNLKIRGLESHVRQYTGLVLDSYFSGTKLHWILTNIKGALEAAKRGDLCFGTIDTWLIWNMTNGRNHVTDYSNASRTLLFDIHKLEWDKVMLEELGIPASMLPLVCPSSYHFGNYNWNGFTVPIQGVAGDQQSALFGQACFEPGEAKNTYGTGCFLLMNTGEKPQLSQHGLLTTIAWGLQDKIHYALEGSVFIAGAAIQWLREGLQFFEDSSSSEALAKQVGADNPVVMVPAFAGLGAPYWNQNVRGAIFGLSRDTGLAHITQATLKSIAFQTKDVLDAMEADAGHHLTALKVDGGACANNYLMQFQANILGLAVYRPKIIESTAMGAAYLAGLYSRIWSMEDIKTQKNIAHVFEPQWSKKEISKEYRRWKKSVDTLQKWTSDE